MKKIYIFIGGYLPAKNYGGPVTSIANLVLNLENKYEFRIVTSDHEFNEKKKLNGIRNGWNDVYGAKVLYLNETQFNYKHIKKILMEDEVSMIYLSSIFHYKLNYPVVRAAKELNIPVLLAPRGELCENALAIGRKKKMLFITLLRMLGYFDKLYYHTTSEEEYLATNELLKIDKKRIFLLPNMHGKNNAEKSIKKKKDRLNILFIARISKKKNLLYAIKIVNKLQYNIQFDIYGPIEDADYWKECQLEISKSPNNINIKYCGSLNPLDAKNIYKNYDCFLFPTFSENYGHVIVEAILSNCPVIISKKTTPWDDIDGHGGFTIDLADEDKFVSVLNRLACMSESEYYDCCQSLENYTIKKLKTEQLIQEYFDMFNRIMNQK